MSVGEGEEKGERARLARAGPAHAGGSEGGGDGLGCCGGPRGGRE